MNVVDLTCELVRFHTEHPVGDELALCRWVAPLLAARGADEVKVVETGRARGGPGGYVYARWGTPRLKRLCCHTRYSVLPGCHSQRSTMLLRSERTSKSGTAKPKLEAPSVTV